MDVDDTNKEEEVSKVDTSATTGNSFGLYGVRIDLSMCRVYITMVPFIYIYMSMLSRFSFRVSKFFFGDPRFSDVERDRVYVSMMMYLYTHIKSTCLEMSVKKLSFG